MVSLYKKAGIAPCPQPFNMAEYVLQAASRTPNKSALLIVSEEHTDRWTFKALREAVLGTANGLLDAGLAPGARILMRLGNTVDFPIAYLGALAAGMVPVPTSAALTKRETQAIIDRIRPGLTLHDPDVPCPEKTPTIDLKQLRSWRAGPVAAFHHGPADRPGYIVFTSGTGGTPRAVVHAHRAIWARQMMFDGWYGLRSDDRVMHAGAFNWTYTLGTGLMDPWTKGATAIIPAPGTDVGALPDLMRAQGATLFAAAPGIYRQMLNHSHNLDLGALRHCLSAGEKLPQSVTARWQTQTGRRIYEAYGMSECSTFVSHPAGTSPDAQTIGFPQPGRRVALIRNGAPVALHNEGTIAVHKDDPGLMLGYQQEDGSLLRALDGEWFLTGDQGVMDAAGQITYLGRNDDMMNAGGFRVSPIEVEQLLAKMPGIDTVAVTDVEIKEDTRVIAAFYTGEHALDDSIWHAYVTDKLARYKQPRIYIHMSALPYGANGKILRRALRDQYERQHD